MEWERSQWFQQARCPLHQSFAQIQSHLEQTDVLLYVDHTFAFATPAYAPHRMSGQGEGDTDVDMVFDPVIIELEIGW